VIDAFFAAATFVSISVIMIKSLTSSLNNLIYDWQRSPVKHHQWDSIMASMQQGF